MEGAALIPRRTVPATPATAVRPAFPPRLRPRPLRAGFACWLAALAPWFAVLAPVPGRSASADPAPVSFNRDIRPILSDHCFACHGPDEKTRKAGLRLDREEESRKALKSGHAAVVPGDAAASSLVARVLSSNPDEIMPPAETKKPLQPGQVELLRRWVAEGARYEGHWAYVPPRRVDPPAVRDAAWVRNDVDRFVAARLEQEGLAPAPEAPREKLLRRVTLDLTGLPPTVEELDAFLADPDAKAYEKVVDRLLSSPHYGERMAQQWLDLARYGETQGYHHDRHRDQWHWRDWVIRAFNANMPYDRFTVEQLAGDLLPEPTRDQLVATGFHRNEMTTSEGGALPEEYIVKYAVGRVDTTARVWLGTSMACAECHDHKYDSITTRDYYRFFAFFFDTPENGLDAEELNPVPRITLESADDRTKLARLDREVTALETAEKQVLEAPRPDWDEAEAAWERRLREDSLDGWTAPKLQSSRILAPATLRQSEDGSVRVADAAGADGAAYELVYQVPPGRLGGVRLEVLPEASQPGRNAGEFLISAVEVEARSLDPGRERDPSDPVVPGPWWSAGPHAAASAKEAYEKEFGPEQGVDLSASGTDGRRTWTERREGPDGDRVAWEAATSALYLTRTLTVKEPRVVEADLTGPAGWRVWLNGLPVSAIASRATGAPPERVRLWLRPGENRLLVKAIAASGAPSPFLDFRLRPEPVASFPVTFAGAATDGPAGPRPAAALTDGNPSTAWSAGTNLTAPRTVWLAARENFGFRAGTEVRVRLRFPPGQTGSRDGVFRVGLAPVPGLGEWVGLPEEVRLALGSGGREGRASEAAKVLAVRRHYRLQRVPEAAETRRLLAARRKERDDFRNGWPTAMVMRPASPARETQIRVRGQYDQKGDTVTPGVPAAILPWPAGQPANRLGLARWLVDPAHPLTARVAVNHAWQRLFGTGLVKTAEEFGSQGEWPSHPALLDWLATEFVRTGWDVKGLQRLLVTSATYRQDSTVSPEVLERDPENRLLARGPRFRLDAENIRDLAMAVSGLLDPRVGGPSVFPYQPPGLWGQVSFEGTRDYVQSEGPDNFRRGLYTYWRRSIPYASFTVFDAPSREVCIVRRPRTNTPLQALALLNDPVYVEAARALAQRILARGGSGLNARIDYAFRVVLGRRPSDRERGLLAAACRREFERYSADRAAANRLIHVGASRPPVDVDIAELAAWTVVASTLLNLDEAVTRG